MIYGFACVAHADLLYSMTQHNACTANLLSVLRDGITLRTEQRKGPSDGELLSHLTNITPFPRRGSSRCAPEAIGTGRQSTDAYIVVSERDEAKGQRHKAKSQRVKQSNSQRDEESKYQESKCRFQVS